MAAIGEKLKGLVKLAKTHLAKVLIGGMGVSMLVVALFQFNEGQTMVFEPTPPQRTEPKVFIDRSKPEYEAVKSLTVRMVEFGESEYPPLVDFNMFDPKSEKDTAALQQDADALVEQGRKALAEGKLDEAADLAKQAGKVLPSHKPSKDLLAEIEAKRAEAAATADKKPATPGAKPPVAAPKAPAPVAK